MDNQSLTLKPGRIRGLFEHVPAAKIQPDDWDWVSPFFNYGKANMTDIVAGVKDGTLDLWRLSNPARGIVITGPVEGKLFIYYLRGVGLFANITSEFLLRCARAEGLSGMSAEVGSRGMQRILADLDFNLVSVDPISGRWLMELPDGR